MKILSRNFTVREKILLLVLAVILVGMLYFRFIDMPVRESIANAESQKASLESELAVVNAQVATLERKQKELDGIEGEGIISVMPSYNNERNVAKLLNDVLGSYGYSISFSNVTRNGDQVRRNISLQFSAPSYDAMENVLEQLANSEYRCIISNVSGSISSRYGYDTNYTVSATLTFFETMAGGIPDAGLPN